jgi:hypothetical protein
MPTLLPTLLDYDLDLLTIIARRWDVDLEGLDRREAAQALTAAMLDPARATAEWGRLSDAERGVLQTLLGAREHKMPEAQFARLFGTIRELREFGPAGREREKPHLQPANVAEALFYRGLIAVAFDQGRTGVQYFVYVPADLAEVLPAHETGFDLSAETEPGWPAEDDLTPQRIVPATTTLVDDLTTLLAYLQVQRVPARDEMLEALGEALAPYWLGAHVPASVALMVSLALSAGLVAEEGGLLKPVPATARRWLEDTRPRQVRALAEAWRSTPLFNELWYTPGLVPEPTGWQNDPLLARQVVLTFLEMVPAGWWPVDDLIALVKEEEPDFQRPAGDYDSWYIRDAASGDYLRGFESWDRVDGAVLRFILSGPMHWLGLTDLGDDGALCRLTPYGRALCGSADWPDPPEERPPLTLQPDGTALAPRQLSRYERFQLARITEWEAAGDPYRYRLTAAGLRRAAGQDVPVNAIRAFLRRTTNDRVPPAVLKLLEQWEHSQDAEVWLERAVILRTSNPELLQTLYDTPELRRFMGARLGPNAVIVREGQEGALRSALQAHGIPADFDE